MVKSNLTELFMAAMMNFNQCKKKYCEAFNYKNGFSIKLKHYEKIKEYLILVENTLRELILNENVQLKNVLNDFSSIRKNVEKIDDEKLNKLLLLYSTITSFRNNFFVKEEKTEVIFDKSDGKIFAHSLKEIFSLFNDLIYYYK